MKYLKLTPTLAVTMGTSIKEELDKMEREELERWIEEKAIELNNEILLEIYRGNYFDMSKDFIRKLVEEILASK